MEYNTFPQYVEHRQVKKWRQAELEIIDGKERLNKATILHLIGSWAEVKTYTDMNRSYYIGEDPYILAGRRSDGSYKDPKRVAPTSAKGYANSYSSKGTTGVPDWRIPVPYGAKIIDTITGYMYKPGSIKLRAPKDKGYNETINKISKKNDTEIKNSEIGINQSINGIGFELIHTDGDLKNPMPRYTQIPLENGIPVYDYSLERKLVAFIYFYTKKDQEGKSHKKAYIYYSWGKEVYDIYDNSMKLLQEIVYWYNEVPVAIYKNNKEDIGDFDRVKSLIDAYDYFMSDNVNELERFAQAYLVLVGARIEKGKEHEIKENRVIQVGDQGAAQFLTKQINAQHMDIMARLLREEIHKQAHIVDFTDEKFGGGLSGAAMDRLLLDMNNLSNVKQIYYEKGLRTRLRLMGKIILTPTAEQPDVEITMTRNVPQDMQAIADWLMKTNNLLSTETRLEQVPIVKDVKAEIKKLNKELGLDKKENETFNNPLFKEVVDANEGRQMAREPEPAEQENAR